MHRNLRPELSIKFAKTINFSIEITKNFTFLIFLLSTYPESFWQIFSAREKIKSASFLKSLVSSFFRKILGWHFLIFLIESRVTFFEIFDRKPILSRSATLVLFWCFIHFLIKRQCFRVRSHLPLHQSPCFVASCPELVLWVLGFHQGVFYLFQFQRVIFDEINLLFQNWACRRVKFLVISWFLQEVTANGSKLLF